MPLLSFYRQTVIRIRPTMKESRGSMVPDWTNVDELLIRGCSVQPAGTSLTTGERVEGITDGLTAYLPAKVDIKTGDRIRFDGYDYTIKGEIRNWPSATGRLDHLVLNLERWHG